LRKRALHRFIGALVEQTAQTTVNGSDEALFSLSAAAVALKVWCFFFFMY
jgi:hypothetical protein